MTHRGHKERQSSHHEDSTTDRTLEENSITADIHRFWVQTGSFYARGMGTDSITDPFIGLGVMPAVTAVFRDMTGIRFNHPE